MAPLRRQNPPHGSAAGSAGQGSESKIVSLETTSLGPDPAPRPGPAPAPAPLPADELFRQFIQTCIEKVRD